MKIIRLAAWFTAFLGIGACDHHKTSPQPPALSSFSMTIEPTDSGITAKCTKGCRWTSVSANCAGCIHRIDAAGIGPVLKVDDPEISFAFNLQEFDGKLVATRVKGTAWTKLSWSCGRTACAAQVDETGVNTGA